MILMPNEIQTLTVKLVIDSSQIMESIFQIKAKLEEVLQLKQQVNMGAEQQ